MSLLAPAALALLALAIPILLLWMLKLRRRDVTVSSTLLWSRLLRDREANAPWQKLRRNLLLFLQLLIVIALVVALARPYLPVPAIASGAVVVLLDASASMQATDVTPSRFAVAQRAAEEMVSGLGGDGLMTVIAAGAQPRVLAAATHDKSVLREAISAARPEHAPADWESAFALAAGAVSGAAESTIVVISDGNLPRDLPSLPGDVRYVPVGREGSTGNLAITALAGRDSAAGLELFVGVANTAPAGAGLAAALLSIYVDGALIESRQLSVPAGENQPVTLTGLPAGEGVIEARLSTEDALALDNLAWTVTRPTGDRRALLVSAGNLFLERALSSLPELQAFRAEAGAPLPAEPYDLYVFDGVLPAELPAAPLLVVDPPPGNPLLTVTGTFSNTQLSWVADDPRLAHVDLSPVSILQARAVEQPSWATDLVRAQGGPLLLAGETGGRRVAALTFDLHQSDLPLHVAFPVLMANLVEWLTPGLPFDAGAIRPGDPVTLYPGDAEQVQITQPDGGTWTAVAGEHLVYAETNQLGLYRLALDGEPSGQFAVNLFDPAESTLTRAETITVGRTEIAPAGGQELGQRELWPWLAAGALVVLLAEWWVYHRGTGLPHKEKSPV